MILTPTTLNSYSEEPGPRGRTSRGRRSVKPHLRGGMYSPKPTRRPSLSKRTCREGKVFTDAPASNSLASAGQSLQGCPVVGP